MRSIARWLRRNTMMIVVTVVLGMAVMVGAAWGVSVHGIIPGIENCRFLGSGERQMGCVVDRADAMMEEDGVVPTLKRLDRLSSTQEFIAGLCHPAMHLVSNRRFDGDAASAFVVGKAARGQCAYGYAHGIIEVAAKSSTDPEMMGIVQQCVGRPTDSERRTCSHGLGHGFRGRLPIAAAAEGCTKWIPARIDRFQCLAGAFMEDAWRDGPKLGLDGDFHAACRGIDGRDARVVCNATIVRRADAAGVPLERAAGMCSDIAPLEGGLVCAELVGSLLSRDGPPTCLRYDAREVRAACFNGLARAAVFEEGHTSVAALGRSCSRLDVGARQCALGLGRSAVDVVRVASDAPDAIATTCGAAFVDGPLRRACLRGNYDILQGVPSIGAPPAGAAMGPDDGDMARGDSPANAKDLR